MNLEHCPECKALVPKVDGEHPHQYIGGSPGCWAMYGEVLAREYSDPTYMSVHRLTVDAHSVQHPGKSDRRSAQSVYGHLVSLYLVMEKNLDHNSATKALKTFVEKKLDLVWLQPPENLGKITIVDIHSAGDAEEHRKLVKSWAATVWEAWKIHHAVISTLAN